MDIYVGNLPYTATEEDVTGLFAAYGPVERVKIITDRETGRSKGFAFVTLGDQSQLNASIEALNGYDFQGRALQAGVRGYVLKESKRPELAAAIHEAMAGRRWLSPSIAKLATERAKLPELSGRQLEVLDLVTKGLTNLEIADMLGFTKDGTKRHLHHIYQKLGVSSRAEATAEALRRGLL